MFASFALFIKNFHTVNDDHAVFNLSNFSHCEKTCTRERVRPRIAGTGTQTEKRDKVTWDDSLSLDATTITLYIIDPRPLTVTKWPTNGNHLPLCLRTSKYSWSKYVALNEIRRKIWISKPNNRCFTYPKDFWGKWFSAKKFNFKVRYNALLQQVHRPKSVIR